MSENPYQSPLAPEPERRWFRKRKPLWHYPLAVVVVPEPSTYALAAIGVTDLLAFRRRKH